MFDNRQSYYTTFALATETYGIILYVGFTCFGQYEKFN